MPNVYKPNLIQIRARYTNEADGDKTENVTWWVGSFTSPLTGTQAANIQAVFDVQWPLMWRIVGVSTAQYIGSIVTDWSSSTGFSYDTTTSLSPVNGLATGLQGSQVSALISEKVLLRYKGGHGRIYLPWLGTSVLNSQTQLTPSTVSNLQAAYNALIGDMAALGTAAGGPWNLNLYKFRNNAVKAALVQVQSGICQANLATQRRRLRKAPHH